MIKNKAPRLKTGCFITQCTKGGVTMSETNKNTKNNDTNKTRVYDVDDLIFGDEKPYESER
jgi:hypothetical protein